MSDLDAIQRGLDEAIARWMASNLCPSCGRLMPLVEELGFLESVDAQRATIQRMIDAARGDGSATAGAAEVSGEVKP